MHVINFLICCVPIPLFLISSCLRDIPTKESWQNFTAFCIQPNFIFLLYQSQCLLFMFFVNYGYHQFLNITDFNIQIFTIPLYPTIVFFSVFHSYPALFLLNIHISHIFGFLLPKPQVKHVLPFPWITVFPMFKECLSLVSFSSNS